MKWLALLVGILLSGLAEAAPIFVRDQTQNSAGTHLTAEIDIAPLFLVNRFGRPSEGDGIRVSGSYTFKSDSGAVFTVYDYKSTTAWAKDENLPTAEEFWSSAQKRELSIGSRGVDPSKFKQWLTSEYQAWKAEPSK